MAGVYGKVSVNDFSMPLSMGTHNRSAYKEG